MRSFRDLSNLLYVGITAVGLSACAGGQPYIPAPERATLKTRPSDCPRGKGVIKEESFNGYLVCKEAISTTDQIVQMYSGNCSLECSYNPTQRVLDTFVMCNGKPDEEAKKEVLKKADGITGQNPDKWVTGREAKALLLGTVKTTREQLCADALRLQKGDYTTVNK